MFLQDRNPYLRELEGRKGQGRSQLASRYRAMAHRATNDSPDGRIIMQLTHMPFTSDRVLEAIKS
jgi:hypothetical protein